MAVYAIGDLQGCYDELVDLLNEINFNDNQDRLWFTGDLVNRGPKSLACLRFVKSLGDKAISVLGNHDLHLLAVNNNEKHKRHKDTFDEILLASDCDELLEWLINQPLIHYDKDLDIVLVHAGLAPDWNLEQVLVLAELVSGVLRNPEQENFLDQMYGNKPDQWSNELGDYDRLRFVINCLTRLRYCTKDGRLVLDEKGPPGSQKEKAIPWFTLPTRKTSDKNIIFGHWSTVTLGNIKDFSEFNVIPLDTGCLWGGRLTALRLDDMRLFSVPSQQKPVTFS